MCDPAPLQTADARDVGTSWTLVVGLDLPRGYRLVGVEVQVSGAGGVRLLGPMGSVVWSTSPSAAGVVGTTIDAPLTAYRLEAQAGSGTIHVTGALTAR